MSAIWQLREELEEDLNGLCICDYISKKDMYEYLYDFDKWAETAEPGDTYYAQDFSYTFDPDYSAFVWSGNEVGVGEMNAIRESFKFADTEDVKSEVENYIAKNGGVGEIYDNDKEETYLSYYGSDWKKEMTEEEKEREC